MTFGEVLSETCVKHKDSIAWVTDETELCYRNVFDRVQRAASVLSARYGVEPGQTVLILAENSVDVASIILACLASGLDVCPVDRALTDHEINACLDVVRPTIVVHQAGQTVPESLAQYSRVDTGELCAGDVTEALPAAASGRLLLYTSGTVGDPKVVVLDAMRHWRAAALWAAHHRFLTPASRFWNLFPMSYNAGILNLLLVPFTIGASVYISPALSSAQLLRFLDIVERQQISILWLNPTLLRSLHRLLEKNPGSHRLKERVDAVFLGMAPISADEKKRYRDWLDIPFYENYALTETQFLTSTLGCWPDASTVGRLLPWIDLKIDSDDALASGPLRVKTETLFEGYMKAGKVLEPPELKEGYFETGDLGRLEGTENELILTGRIKESIKRGGYLVEFGELEALAMLSPRVEEALAVPVDDAIYGENTVICLVLKDPRSFEEAIDEVSTRYKTRLAAYKRPEKVVVMKAFPKSVAGKSRRQQVRRNYLENQFAHASKG